MAVGVAGGVAGWGGLPIVVVVDVVEGGAVVGGFIGFGAKDGGGGGVAVGFLLDFADHVEGEGLGGVLVEGVAAGAAETAGEAEGGDEQE